MAAGTRRATIMASWPAPLVMERGLTAGGAGRRGGEQRGEIGAHGDGGLIDGCRVGDHDAARCGCGVGVVDVVLDGSVRGLRPAGGARRAWR